MKLYSYYGPVLAFDRIVTNCWKASTYAESEARARCNLEYQFKLQTGRAPRSKISIPGKLTVIEGKDIKNERT